MKGTFASLPKIDILFTWNFVMKKNVWTFKYFKRLIKHLHEFLNNISLKLAMLETRTQEEHLLVFQEWWEN